MVQRFPDKVEKGVLEHKISVESIRYIYMMDKETAKKLPLQKLSLAENGTQFDDILSAQLKKSTNLYLISNKFYGHIVNMLNYPQNTTNPEFYRVLENHYLWERRFINPNVSLHKINIQCF